MLNRPWKVLTSNPVNRFHPLNRGRISWWLSIPPRAGGVRWYNLVGGGHGTVTGYYSVATWRGSSRPGGRSHLHFGGDTSASYCDMPCAVTGPPLTVSFWFRASAISPYQTLFMSRDNGPSGVHISGATGNPLTAIWSSAEAEYDGSTGLTVSIGRWYFACWVVKSTGWTLYLGDPSSGTLMSHTFTSSLGSRSITNWWAGMDSASRFWNGDMDDISIYNRAITWSEMKLLYDESWAGYPGTLRWLPSHVEASISGDTGPASVRPIIDGSLIGSPNLIRGVLVR